MELFKNVVEYYEELFPASMEQKKFYEKEACEIRGPAKCLRIGCGSGAFELALSKENFDVTGIETCSALLDSANRKRRTMLMSVRFFNMSTLEMSRYLGKGFYDIISILDDRLILIHDKTLLEKFFFDCRQLLKSTGKLIISVPNFEKYNSEEVVLPVRESIRVKLTTVIKTNSDKSSFMNQILETGSGSNLIVSENVPVQRATVADLKQIAENNGFSSVRKYGSFGGEAFSDESDYAILVFQ